MKRSNRHHLEQPEERIENGSGAAENDPVLKYKEIDAVPRPIGSGYEAGYAYDGAEALQMLERLLAPTTPRATEFAREVVAFYGEDFLLSIYQYGGSSDFQVYNQPPDKVNIRLKLSDCNDPSTVVHELLHGDLIRQGFPWLEYREGEANDEHIRVMNFLHHAIMLPKFEDFGFPHEQFLTPSPTIRPPFYMETPDPDSNESKWPLVWLSGWLEDQFLGNTRHTAYMQKNWSDFQESAPNIDQISQDVKAWFNRPNYVRPDNFEQAYNELLELIKVPPPSPDRWYRLKRENGRLIRY